MGRRRLAMLLTALLCGCGQPGGQAYQAGEFTGSVLLMWVGEGGPGDAGGRFVYVPSPARPLVFTRPGSAGGLRIRPGIMYTDGGSIPRPFQMFRGFSPWGYGPAYIVHDWLFVAKRCLADGRTDAAYLELKDLRFRDSQRIMGEALETLAGEGKVKRDDFAMGSIAWAVGTTFSADLWEVAGECAAREVTPEHLAEVQAALAQFAPARVDAALRTARRDPAVKAPRAAVIVQEILAEPGP